MWKVQNISKQSRKKNKRSRSIEAMKNEKLTKGESKRRNFTKEGCQENGEEESVYVKCSRQA